MGALPMVGFHCLGLGRWSSISYNATHAEICAKVVGGCDPYQRESRADKLSVERGGFSHDLLDPDSRTDSNLRLS
jgi:hypothetical protein